MMKKTSIVCHLIIHFTEKQDPPVNYGIAWIRVVKYWQGGQPVESLRPSLLLWPMNQWIELAIASGYGLIV